MNKLLMLAMIGVSVFGAKVSNNGKATGNPNNGNNGVNGNGRGNAGGGGNPGHNGGDDHGNNGGGGNPGHSGGDDHNGGGNPGHDGGDDHGNNGGGGNPEHDGGDDHGNNGGGNPVTNPGVPVVPHPVVVTPPTTQNTGLPLWETMLIAEHIIAGHTDNRFSVPWCDTGKPLRDEFNNHIYCGHRFVDCPLGSQCVHGKAVNIAMCCPEPITSVPSVVLPPVFIAKCPLGSPWKDLNGLELYCGPPAFGMQQVNCPFGSRCETPGNNAYFACCSV